MKARPEPPCICVVCGEHFYGYEGISVTGEGDHCMPCYNTTTAAQMGIAFDQADLAPVTLLSQANQVLELSRGHRRIRARRYATDPRPWRQTNPLGLASLAIARPLSRWD